MIEEETLKASTQWFHVLREMVDSGELAKLDGAAVKLYLVVKAHCNYETGYSFPSLETLTAKSGLSLSTVQRSLKQLEEHNLISREKKGRSNFYTLREKINIEDNQGRVAAIARWDYLPSTMKNTISDLKNVIVTGDLAGAKIVKIEKLQIQIINGQNNLGIQTSEADLANIEKKNPAIHNHLLSIRCGIGSKTLATHDIGHG